MRRAFLAAALSIAATCTDHAEIGDPIDGAWSQTLPNSVVFLISLNASGTTVTGTGTYTSLTNPQPISLTITGQWVEPDLTLTFTGFAGGTAAFTGELLPVGSLVGTISGGPFSNQTLSLIRR